MLRKQIYWRAKNKTKQSDVLESFPKCRIFLLCSIHACLLFWILLPIMTDHLVQTEWDTLPNVQKSSGWCWPTHGCARANGGQHWPFAHWIAVWISYHGSAVATRVRQPVYAQETNVWILSMRPSDVCLAGKWPSSRSSFSYQIHVKWTAFPSLVNVHVCGMKCRNCILPSETRNCILPWEGKRQYIYFEKSRILIVT